MSNKRFLGLPRIGFFDCLSFLAPLLRFLEIDLVGRLYLTEILLAAVLPFLFARYGRRLSEPLPRVAIVLLLLWLFAQVITDLVRGSHFEDYARGWAMIGFTLINFCSVYLLLRGYPKRLVLFAAGAALGGLIAYYVAPDDYSIAHPWKFGYGSTVTWSLVLLAVAVTSRKHSMRMLPATVLLGTAVLNMYMGSRAVGGVVFLAGCYLAAQSMWGKRSSLRRLRPPQLVFLGLVAIFGAWSALQVYEYSSSAGWLGEDARHKYEMQTAGDYGLLLGGRSEILAASQAIADSPILGHGSWAKNCEYSSLLIELKRLHGYYAATEADTCLIPTHSHLFGAWVQSGILGTLFWFWVLIVTARGLVHSYSEPTRLSPLVAFVAFSMVWAVFFSPFAGAQRFITPYFIVLIISQLPQNREKRRSFNLRASSLSLTETS